MQKDTKKVTQYEKIIMYIDKYGSITPFDAFREFGITRLAARIFEMRMKGINISGERESGKNRFGETVHYMRYRRVG
jgi:hypothetical protein